MNNTFVTADQHFWHKNIIKYEVPRQVFKDVEDMNEQMVSRWNEVVKPEDIVWHLGDVCLANKEKAKEIIQRLNGIKYLVMGNHDKQRGIGWWKDCGFEEVYTKSIKFGVLGNIILAHEPEILLPTEKDSIKKVIHGHIHSQEMVSKSYDISKYVCVSVEKTNFYPINIKEII